MGVLSLLVLAALPGCQRARVAATPPATSPPAGGPGAEELLEDQRRMATLSFLAYVGGRLEGDDDSVEKPLAACLSYAIENDPTVDGWSLAWGPAVYKFALAELDDNMMYVVRNDEDPAHLAIVVRGTNPPALLDWLVEDLDVVDQVTWETGSPPDGAKISKAISEGLHILQTMTAAGPDGETTLTGFLAEQSTVHPALRIDVTGHSLGGALSPALALWLADTEAQWNESPTRARFAVYPLAGPTLGNAELAAYYDSRLGSATHRMQSSCDVVPLFWNVETMATVADLYGSTARASDAERLLLDGVRHLVADKGYTQIRATQTPLSGVVDGEVSSFAKQAGWQHHCSYQCALGINVLLPSKVPGEDGPQCDDPTATSCASCPTLGPGTETCP
jgi:hypothetical protein